MNTQKQQSQLYVFKVALTDAKRIWRRIEILSNQSLDQLHEAIFQAFDRYDEHMYSFYLTKTGSRSRRRFVDVPEFTHPYAFEDPYGWNDENIKDASKTKIKELALKEKSKFEYIFDFGDEWLHQITLEKIMDIFTDKKYPIVIRKTGNSPEQYPDSDEY
jgi:hypothetical protein